MGGTRLHVGCGAMALPGWVNIDIRPQPGVDVVLDVREGLPYDNVEYIFAEHFIEHLDLETGLQFLRECRGVLDDTGVIRISTPNLDWVWATAYQTRWREVSASTASIDPTEWAHDDDASADCLEINRAFRAWGHRFLYNRSLLTECLRMARFANLEWCSYGKSRHLALIGLERHERSLGISGVPDVLIVEASGVAAHRPSDQVESALSAYRRDIEIR